MNITIVIPTFNEVNNIDLILDELKQKIFEKKKEINFDILIIDNNSNDGTQLKIKKIASENNFVKVIVNRRNFGPFRSPFYALMQVQTDAAIIIPADFQIPIVEIHTLIEKFKEGHDVVLFKRKRNKENLLIKGLRSFFYKTLNMFSDRKLIENATGDGIYSIQSLKILKEFYDPYPFTRSLILEAGLNISVLEYTHQKRRTGSSGYNFMSLVEAGLMGFVKHSRYFVRIMILIGFALSLISIFIALAFLFYKLFYWDNFELGMAPIIIGLFGFNAFLLFITGLIGEYLLTILDYSRKFPLVIEKERINFDKKI